MSLKWFYNLKISVKLIIGFLTVLLFMVIVGFLGVYDIGKVNSSTDDMYHNALIPIKDIADADRQAIYHKLDLNMLINETDINEMKLMKSNMNADEAKMKTFLDSFAMSELDEKEKEYLEQFTPLWEDYIASAEQAAQYSFEGNKAAAIDEMNSRTNPAFKKADDLFNEIINYNSQHGDQIITDAKALYEQSRMIILTLIASAIAVGFAIAFGISAMISRPILLLRDASDKLASGNIDVKIVKKSNDELGALMDSFHKMIDNIAEQSGNAQKISEGELDIDIVPKSEHDILALSMQKVIHSLRSLVDEARLLTNAAVEGVLSTRGNEDRFHGGYRQIISGMNDTLDAISRPLDTAKDFAVGLADGTQMELIPDADQYKGYYGDLIRNQNGILETLLNMLSEIMELTEEAGKGNLSHRADVSKLNGVYGTLVQGVNETLDAVIGPLNMAANYVDRISKGDIPEKITDRYHGDFNVIKNNLNTCIDAIELLVTDTGILVDAAVEGRLGTRADADRHQGGFAKIVTGVNQTLDAVIGPLNAAAYCVDRISKGDIPEKITDEYRGDFNVIKDNLNTCIEAVNRLVEEAGMLADAAIEGRLNTRADADKHEGDFARIVQGVNATLDAIIKPVQEASETLQEIAQGNLSARMEGEYQGDYASIKNDLNFVGETLKGYIDELSDVLGQMADKDFTGEIEREYLGDFGKLKDSINFIEEQFNEILTEINGSADQVESGAGQVASTSQGLSQGASEQAGSIEEISGTITGVAEQTRQNVSNANKANELSLKAKTDAEKGKVEMENMLNAMEEIKEASKNISKIVKVIDDIAFQTNILALNAAVEAARAGQHGRGFAVVAEEVRSLATRSAAAVRETTDMIDHSVRKVEEGSVIANQTAGALNKIVEGVTDAVKIVEKISEASVLQATSIAQIDSGISQISSITQSNTATAEESAAASEEMAGQAQILRNMIREFNLKDIVPYEEVLQIEEEPFGKY